MIISASRRTDIPAFYSEWFINRLKEGFVYIKNPRNANRVTYLELSPDVVDCIVFWTKNPQLMLNKLDIINAMGFQYYFQFTITPYSNDMEKGLPIKAEIMETFKRLSDKIGKHRVVWRYDPIIVSKDYSVQYHVDTYGEMCDILSDYTNKCVFSFIDLYTKVREKTKGMVESEVSILDINKIVKEFSKIAEVHKLELASCSETINLSLYDIGHAACIDSIMIENIIGYPIRSKKDANQRPACACAESIDIGAYDCCSHGCIYCYATTSEKTVEKNILLHDPDSPILVGSLRGDEIITTREAKSLKVVQTSLF